MSPFRKFPRGRAGFDHWTSLQKARSGKAPFQVRRPGGGPMRPTGSAKRMSGGSGTWGATSILVLLLSRWTGFVYRFPVLVAAVVLLLAALAAVYSVRNLGVDTDERDMFDPGLQFQRDTAEFDRAFPRLDDPIIVVVRSPTHDEAEAFSRKLVERLAARKQSIRGVFAASIDPFLVRNGLLYVDTGELESLLRDLTIAFPLLEYLRRKPKLSVLLAMLANAAKSVDQPGFSSAVFERICEGLSRVVLARLAGRPQPLSWSALSTGSDANVVLAVSVEPVLDYASLEPAKKALKAIDEEVESVVSGIGLSFAVSLLLVAVLLYTAFRSIVLAVITLVSLIATLLLTAGFATIAVGTLNLISIAFVVLLVGLGLDFAIHLLLHVQESRRRGADTEAALRKTVTEIGAALALCAPTTALAFFAFIPTNFDGMAQLGLIGGTGVVLAFLVAVTLLPALLALLPSRPGRLARATARPIARGVWRRVGGPLAVVTTVLGVAGIALLPSVRFDADPMTLRDPESPSVRAFQKLLDDEATMPYRLNLLVEDAETAEAISDALRILLEVTAVRTLDSFIPAEQQQKLDLISRASGELAVLRGRDLGATVGQPAAGDEPAAQAARLRRQLADAPPGSAAARLAWALAAFEARDDPKQWAGLERDVFRFWPQFIARLTKQLSPERVTRENLPEPLKERFLAYDGRFRIEIAPWWDVRDVEERRGFVDAVQRVVTGVSGSALTTLKAGEVVAEAMIQATGLAFGLVAILLWLVLRSFRKVVLVLLPLALAAILTCAASVLLGLPFNYANVIVLPLLIGIGVDSGIHLVERSDRLPEDGSIYGTSTPRAVLFSALTTVAAFGSLALSDHRGTASMGAMLAIGIGFTLLTTLVVLPRAMALVQGRRAQA